MKFEDSLKKLEESFGDEPQLICPKGQNYEEYLTAQIAKLKTFLIIPEKARVTSASFKQYDFERYKIGKVWAIAKAENNWLLTLDGELEFALAFGNDINNLEMLGFSSSDALAEWLG